MPCYDERNDSEYIKKHLTQEYREINEQLRERNNYLTRLLCEACKILDSEGGDGVAYSPELAAWKEAHEKFDEERKKR